MNHQPGSPLAERFSAIGIDRRYSDIDWLAIAPDVQGWASTNPCFDALIDALRPSLVVEVGTWKGASLLAMANAAKWWLQRTRSVVAMAYPWSNEMKSF